MHINSWAVATAVTLFVGASVAEPEVERPRIYYPRNVKREITNNTSSNPAGGAGQSSAPAKGGLIGDLLDGLLGGGNKNEATATKKTGSQETSIVVTPTGVVPTEDEEDDQPTSTKKGGLLDPILDPIVTNLIPPKSTDNASSDTGSNDSGSGDATTEEPTTSGKKGLLDPILDPIVTNLLPSKSTTAADEDTSDASDAEPTTTKKGGLLDPILDPIVTNLLPPKSTTAADEDASDAEPTTSTKKPGLLDPILDPIITNILPPKPTTTNGTDGETQPTTTTKKPGLLDPIIDPIITNVLPPKPTTTDETDETDEPTTTKGGILDPIITNIIPEPSDDETTTEGPLIPTLIPTLTIPDIDPTVIPDPDDTETGGFPGAPEPTTTEEPVLPPPPPPSSTDLGEIPIVNGTNTETAPEATDSAPAVTTLPDEEAPTATATSGAAGDESSAPPASATDTNINTNTGAAPTSVAEPTEVAPTTEAVNPSNWLPSTIVAAPTETTQPTQNTETSQTMPTDIPSVILPDDPNRPPPQGSTLINIGFLFPLNYVFVAKNTVAAAQIFKFLPQGLAEAGGFSEDKIMVARLIPYDTNERWGYTTTIAKVYYPENMIEALQMDLLAPNSRIYNNDIQIVEDLTSVINPKIDIFGNLNEDGTGSTGGSGSDDDDSGHDSTFDAGDGGKQSSKKIGTTAGIAVGAVGVSVMYGAAMFIVARRYKRKRQAHKRSSSVGGSSHASSEMRYTGAGSPALMGGALLSRDFSGYGGVTGGRESHGSYGSARSGMNHSARTANISAPMAAENSLGWN